MQNTNLSQTGTTSLRTKDEVIDKTIESAKLEFMSLSANSGLIWEHEKFFALSMLIDSESGDDKYLYKTAKANPFSLQTALSQVGSLGLTLNPAEALCYLVPRQNVIKLDISYQGLITIATRAKVITDCYVELVYENDGFKYKGKHASPEHYFNPFDKDRGELIGGFCVASLNGGGVKVEAVTVEDIHRGRDSSKAQNGPWKTWFNEMAKKFIFKRAAKNWPKNDGNSVLAKGLHIINEHEGLDLPDSVVKADNSMVIDSYDLKQISPVVIERVQQVVARAAKDSAWAAAEDYLKENFINEDQLYALDMLNKANPSHVTH